MPNRSLGELSKKLHKIETNIRRLESLIQKPSFGVGTTFPTNPATNSAYYRTDLGYIFYYTGAEWRSEEQHFGGTLLCSVGDTNNIAQAMNIYDADYAVSWISLRTLPASPNDDTDYFTVFVISQNLTRASDTVHYSFDAKDDADDDWTARDVAPTIADPGTNFHHLAVGVDINNSPGDLIIHFDIFYYWIAT